MKGAYILASETEKNRFYQSGGISLRDPLR